MKCTECGNGHLKPCFLPFNIGNLILLRHQSRKHMWFMRTHCNVDIGPETKPPDDYELPESHRCTNCATLVLGSLF